MMSHPLSKSYSENQHCLQFAMTQVSGVTISSFGSIVIKLLTIKVFKHSETTLQTPKQEINFNMCIHHMKICLKHSEITLQTPKQEINFNVCILHMKYMNYWTIAYTS